MCTITLKVKQGASGTGVITLSEVQISDGLSFLNEITAFDLETVINEVDPSGDDPSGDESKGEISPSADKQEANPGDTVTVTIKVKDLEEQKRVTAFQFFLNYDENFFEDLQSDKTFNAEYTDDDHPERAYLF